MGKNSIKNHIILFLFLFTPLASFSSDYELSICCIFQNEAPYLKEWIDYHRKVGVEHFYLYNNESTDDWNSVLKQYMDKGIVECVEWPDTTPEKYFAYNCQPAAYRDCLNRSKGKTKWLAIIDSDEYIVPKKYKNIKKVLRNHFEGCGAIYVNWLQFGTGGVNIGPGPILKHLTKCAPPDNWYNKVGKSIVRPEIVVDCQDPHSCILLEPNRYINGSGKMKIDDQHHEDLLRINHYTFRDEWYFWNIKVERYKKWNWTIEELLKKNEESSTIEDLFMVNLLKQLHIR